jgi:hypothetical protein
MKNYPIPNAHLYLFWLKSYIKVDIYDPKISKKKRPTTHWDDWSILLISPILFY